MTISILGSHVTQFGELWERDLLSLLSEASFEAIRDAQIEQSDIEAIYVSNMLAGIVDGQLHLGALVSSLFPHLPPGFHIEGACASGGLALLAAEDALHSGKYSTVLVVGGEKMTDVSTSVITQALSGAADISREFGSTFPGLYALLAQAHMQRYGTTREQLSSVSVKNHLHGMKNMKAQFRKKITIEKASMSQMVAEPLRLLDCSPISDGAAAVVLSTKRSKYTPRILGVGIGMDTLALCDRKELTSLAATKKAAKIAFAQAKLQPKDIDLVEVHDCFTIAEILAIEDLGFFPAGQGGPATLAGQTTFGGKILVNPSGGLKATGHPIGATGIKQVAYIAEALRTKQATYALAHNVGGTGATAVVHILGDVDE